MSERLHRQERGQVLVIVAVGLVVLVAMVGVVIDGGFAWGKQRETQNASDSAASAGAVVLAANLAGTVPAKTDADVLAAVNAAGAVNNIGSPAAYYTDFDGNLIDAAGLVVATESLAAPVGDGAIPPGAAGVKAIGQQTFDTFLVQVIGFDQLTATTTATARAGYLGGECDADAGCFVLPITVPVTILGCDGSNRPAPDPGGAKWLPSETPVVIPLCQNGPGNVGWLDWTPTAGGTSELTDAIANPSNPFLKWPGWYFVTSTGNVNSLQVETALRAYDGDIVQFPQFDATCDETPTGPLVTHCPDGHLGGNGSNQWYHLAGMGSFQFCDDAIAECTAAGLDHGAYITGSNSVCESVSPNGGTSCLAGRFQIISYEGQVQAAPGPNSGTASVGIQLIR